MKDKPFLLCFLIGLITQLSGVSQDDSLRSPEKTRPLIKIDFETDIAPIFSSRCVECHNPQEKNGGLDLSNSKSALIGGESGKGIVPHDAEKSELWKKVSAREMPPTENPPLTNSQLQKIKEWIASGALWPADRILDQYLLSTPSRAGNDWWSLQPIVRPPIPKRVADTVWKNPIDSFVGKALKEKGLVLSGEADRSVLIRRLYFDLLGLPPTPQHLQQFLEDTRPDAYQRLVEQLLSSPRYGERWGRHWMDIAHYADTHGYERDQPRHHAWRYRDYIIESFNHDRPYDQFLIQQIAGDVMDPDNPQSNIATGFLASGPYDYTGIEEALSEKLKRQALADDMDDLVTTVMTSTMGLTVNCARCHNHKFDPISQQDYYQLTAVFAGMTKQDRVITNLDKYNNRKKTKLAIRSKIGAINEELRSLADVFDLADLVGGGDGSGNAPDGMGLDPRTGLFAKGTTGSLEGVKVNHFVTSPAACIEGCFIPDGGPSAGLGVPITSGGLKIQLPKTSGSCWDYFQKGPCNSQDFTELDGVDYNGPGHTLLSIHSNKGITFDLVAIRKKIGVRNLRFTSTMGFGGKHAESSADVFVFVDGKKVLEHQHVGRGSGGIPIDLRLEPQANYLTLVVTDDENGIGHDQIFFGDAWIQSVEEKSDLEKKRIGDLLDRRKELQSELRDIIEPTDLVFAAVGKEQPGQVHLLSRGDPEARAQEVFPAGLSCLTGLKSNFGSGKTSEKERRKKLAEWIIHPQNPLTSRVLVNRLWHHHFGRGIVKTPSDFGFLGSRPSHPQLLDWLAAEFLESGWSIKQIHRLILTSGTYRQRSDFNGFATTVDSDNQLLWRMNPRRLDIESIRDAILSVSGTINLAAGGPGYKDFDFVDKYAPVYKFITADRPELWKRTVYRFTVRSVPNRFMKILDCPNPSSLTPRRSQTTTALQSLSLLNNPFMIDQAKYFANRLEDQQPTLTQQVDLAFRLTFARPPSPQELTASCEMATENGLFYFCRALLNSNEFIYLD